FPCGSNPCMGASPPAVPLQLSCRRGHNLASSRIHSCRTICPSAGFRRDCPLQRQQIPVAPAARLGSSVKTLSSPAPPAAQDTHTQSPDISGSRRNRTAYKSLHTNPSPHHRPLLETSPDI